MENDRIDRRSALLSDIEATGATVVEYVRGVGGKLTDGRIVRKVSFRDSEIGPLWTMRFA